ncbi:hypothetical protein IV203_032288 [Nitzschia inconspicua]|uniref:Uncharacterized protein n=1 Tax=Nitzschia inconspicua TaxID=303405 RepID=A0A9K3PEN9_9STRA|nr:hypothetical protein IV203_032288 [Nitzschia inconspicua]
MRARNVNQTGDCHSNRERQRKEDDFGRSISERNKFAHCHVHSSRNGVLTAVIFVLAAFIGSRALLSLRAMNRGVFKLPGHASLKVHNSSTTTAPDFQCPPNSGGLIVLNLLGRLGNNFFEIGFANILARELCWEVIYRPMWANFFLNDPKATQCFPNALLPTPHKPNEEWKTSLRIQDSSLSFWKQLTYTESEHYNEQVLEWVGNLTSTNKNGTSTSNVLELAHTKVNIHANQMSELIHQVGYPQDSNNSNNLEGETSATPTFAGTAIPITTNPKRLLFLSAFFIQYDWLAPYLEDMRYWFAFNSSCCRTSPPPDKTVVIHVRNHEHGMGNYQLSVYKDILKQFGYDQTYNIWIICQPEYKEDKLMKDFVTEYGNDRVRIETGVDEVDAVCIMKHAPVLIVSSGSTFSMMAALLAEPSLGQVVHYPVERLEYPEVTIKVPTWKYHLVDHPSNAKVLEFDFDQDLMHVKMH